MRPTTENIYYFFFRSVYLYFPPGYFRCFSTLVPRALFKTEDFISLANFTGSFTAESP